MSKPEFIGCVPRSTPAAPGMPLRQSRPLPDDLLKEASRRLGIMSLVAAALWLIATMLDHVAVRQMGPGAQMPTQVTDTIAAVSAIISIALFFYTRRDSRAPVFILNLGLAYMVFTAFSLGLMAHWYPPPPDWHLTPMISWIGTALLIFAAIVPNPPAKTLVVGLISVSMNPLGMLLAHARGIADLGPSSNVLVMHYPDYLLVGVAVVISHVVTKLGHQVTRAREMGSYRLVTMLGKGGMGEVWRASHGMLARDAAIKLIKPEMLVRTSGKDAAMLQRRFEQEARTTASLRSPHTVQLYDFGITEHGVFYYAMELLDGIDLETLVRNFGPLPASRVVHILRQVCRSLAEAHSHGIIHRDIKPTNVFLCRMGNEYDFAKVLDFGLVKKLDTHEAQMTVAGATTGTPAFMPPELAIGSPHIDGRTDLYGLGCVAYWLVTGSLVFPEKSAAAMISAHLRDTPVAPSKRTQLAVPPSLDGLIMMCLAKTPAERPASAEVLGLMLEKCEGVGAWTAENAERWWRANAPGPHLPRTEQTRPSAFSTV